MTGVEILTTQEVATAFAFSWENFWIGMSVILFIGLFLGAICSMIEKDIVGLIAGGILGVVFGCMLGVGVGIDSIPTEYETQYKVTISDEVSMNDFLERYEIVSQEGKIYTVREIADGK